MAQMVMNLPVISNAGDPVGPLRGEDPPEKGRATHSSILAGEFHGQKSCGLAGYTIHGVAKSWTQLQGLTLTYI